MEKPSNTWDVVVVGAGPAGSVLASTLAKKGYRVGLLHNNDRAAHNTVDWPEMMSPEVVLSLEQCGVRIGSDSFGGRWCRGVMEWIDVEPEVRDFELYHASLGLFVSRLALAKSLRNHAIDSGVELLTRNESREVIGNAKFVVEASGAHSSVPGFPRKRFYLDNAIGVCFEIGGLKLPNEFLHLMMLDSGWSYLVPTEGRKTLAVFVTNRAWLRKHRPSLPASFRQAFQVSHASRCLLDGLESIEVRGIRDARTSCRECLGEGNWLPIGDAAYTLNPITGSGLARSIGMAMDASDAIADYLRHGDRASLASFVCKLQVDFVENAKLLSMSPYGFRGGNGFTPTSSQTYFVSSDPLLQECKT